MNFSLKNHVKSEIEEFKILLKNIPALVVSLFILSVVCANLMANKELVNFKYLALDCGFVFSWIMFLCMDVICKRWGAGASIRVSVLALFVNLSVCIIFFFLSKTGGMWGEFYATENPIVNDALNKTIGGTWYVVLGSATAFISSAIINALINRAIGKSLKKDNFASFAIRSYVSTIIAQFADNMIFAIIVSKMFFGWTWTQVILCSCVGAVCELLCEVLFSGFGYKVVRGWEKDKVGQEYIERHESLKKLG